MKTATSLRAIQVIITAFVVTGASMATAAEQAKPVPRIVITAKRMTDAEKMQYAEQERQAQEQQTRNAGAQRPQRSRQVAAPSCSNC
jgi:hypothetical protein